MVPPSFMAGPAAEPGLWPIASLFQDADTPLGVLEADGLLVYANPALEKLLQACGADGRERPLADWAQLNGAARRLFDEAGRLRPEGLPYRGPCLLSGREGRRFPAMLRLEPAPGDETGRGRALCLLRTLASGPGEEKVSSDTVSAWQERIDEIGDSFDPKRIGSKACRILGELSGAGAVAFYWLNTGGMWVKSAQTGDRSLAGRIPWRFRSGLEWLSSLAGLNEAVSLEALGQWRGAKGWRDLPDWVLRPASGFVLPCRFRGDTLALLFAWGGAAAPARGALRDLTGMVASQSAQAVDNSRWFQLAHQKESRSAALIDHANAIILGVDLQGCLTLWNRKAEEVFGYTRDEIVGKPVYQLFGDDTAQADMARDRFRAAIASREGLAEFELDMRDRQGRLRHVVWNTNVLETGDEAVLGLYAIGQDITRRKSLEKRLSESERRYRSFVETTHDIYWMLRFEDGQDLESATLSFLNRSFAGRTREQLVGRAGSALRETFTDESWEAFAAAARQVCQSRRPVRHLETSHLSPDAAKADAFLLSDLFPCIEENRLVGVQALSIDVTDRKEIEAQMLQAQKLESIGTLARGISHDFSNIINGIAGFSYLIQRYAEDPEKVKSHSQSIQELARRAGGLTRQLQTYARQSRPEKRCLDLNVLIEQTVSILDCSLRSKAELELELEPGLEWIEADRSQIEQVLMNLCINAAEAMPAGGKLRIRTRTLRGDEAFPGAGEGKYSVLEVGDTGVGMTPEVRQRIFDPFFTTKKTGNGLGLSAVYGVIKNHRAEVQVDSELGRGTTFTIYFPAAAEKRRSLGLADAAALRGGNETILIADDEAPIRLVAEDMLTTLGYRVIVAQDGEEALRIFQERPQAIHLALMDIAMPKLNGRMAAKAMRLLRPDLKVLFTSGYSDKDQVQTLAADGFPHFLAKPYAMLDLQKAVRCVLDGEAQESDEELKLAQ